jgi:SAM-dependent methyltransferase
MANVKHVTECRSCSAPLSKTIFDIGELKINAFVSAPNRDIGSAPLTLMHCENCDLIQLSHTVREEDLYKNYWYLSRLNKKIVDNLESIVVDVSKEVEVAQDDIVLDIGANDGTLLTFWDSDNVVRVGCDPAENIHSELEKNCDVMIGDFFNQTNWNTSVGYGKKAKVVTTVAMFYDLDDPNSFVNDIKQVLADDGVWLCQLMTARPMLDTNDLGNVIHEHIEYYSYKSLVNLMERHGLEIFQVRENDINGGSYQLYIRHMTTGSCEFDEDISVDRISQWAKNIAQNRSDTMEFIRQEVADGKKIYIMGASTKGNTIMQYYGLDSDTITGAAEIHPDKIGKYLVGSSIPIVHEDDAKADADYFLVFPFHFKELFTNHIMKDWIAEGGKLIFCTPEFEVVDSTTS